MYLEKAIFVNRAPFERLELDFKEKGVNVLTAINGKGKTTILSHITDAFYELAKTIFSNSFKGIENSYYRFSSSLFSLNANIPSFVYFRFKQDDKNIDYVDVRGNCTEEYYNSTITLEYKIPFEELKLNIDQAQNTKHWSISDDKEKRKIFSQSLLTYFPSYRYEVPGYLNEPYSIKTSFTKTSLFSDQMVNRIEVVSDIPALANWMLDVLLDMKLSEENAPVINNNEFNYRQIISTEERTFVWNNLNKIISETLSSKYRGERLRLGIGDRLFGVSRVSITNETRNNSVSLFHLSSGELSLISLFGEILHQADNNHKNVPLEQITGIVLVDEIDKHLHITLQKDVLPKLFALFPNVQFIVSSHSPFLNMGLAETCPETHKIFDLDNDGHTYVAEKNDEYLKVYNMMVNENQRYVELYNNLKSELDKVEKTLVITEGKTDIQHILKAKEKLGLVDIQFETICSSCQPDGDEDLYKLLEQLAKVPRTNKVIGIFDRDNEKIIRKIQCGERPYKSFGNNVFAFCIDVPQYRRDCSQNSISIEYLYSDEEIHASVDEKGRHLFFGNEFSDKSGKGLNSSNLLLSLPKGRGQDKIIESLGGQAVYNEIEENVLATKATFADAITNEIINISQNSWENFRPILVRIKNILNLDR